MEKGSNKVGGSAMNRPVNDNQLEKMLHEISYKDTPLPDNFEEELHEKLLNSEKPISVRPFSIPVAAFTVTLIFIAGFLAGKFLNREKPALPVDNPSQSAVIADAEVTTGETVTVKLVYVAETEINDVTFSITLPAGLVFHSENSEIASLKTIEWSGTLHKGRNEIPFVVKARSSGKWLINASAVYDSGELTHEITVYVSSLIARLVYDSGKLTHEITVKETEDV